MKFWFICLWQLFFCSFLFLFFFFFFQAEDGIRDLYVTGVQTCALPISDVARVFAKKAEPVKKDFIAHLMPEDFIDRLQAGIEAIEHSIQQQAASKGTRDRKSTRLNSSHVEKSYAVFCLKKKTDVNKIPH